MFRSRVNWHPSLRAFVAGVEEPTSPFVAVQTHEVELSEPLPEITGESPTGPSAYARARIFVRLHRQPIGLLDVDLACGPVTSHELEQQIWAKFKDAITTHLAADGAVRSGETARPPFPLEAQCPAPVDVPQWTPLVSVIICTLGRPRQLQNALDALLRLAYPNFEIVVVDNDPNDSSTKEMIDERYVHLSNLRYEPQPLRGLSAARNRGIDVAVGEILAFTDDDIIVDRYWLSSLVSGFDPEGMVACVTGLTLASELESRAQTMFEEYGAFNRGYETRLFKRDSNPASTILYPYTAGVFGGGGNSAIRLDSFPGELRFDRRLGPGTRAFGAEDLDIFLQTILHGKYIRYVPSAIAWHEHRRSYQDLRWQLFTYGAGFTALLTKWTLHDYRIALDLARLAPRLVSARLRADTPEDGGSHRLPKDLRRLELFGFLYGPIALIRSVVELRRSTLVDKS